jgi:hypothetical protein
MERILVNSNELKSVGYDPSKRTLEIEFVTGEILQYIDIPERIYQGLLRTESQGKYINALIKNIYRSNQIK